MKTVSTTTARATGNKNHPRRKIGEILVAAGVVDAKNLALAIETQKAQGKKLGQVLIDMGVTDDVQIARALSTQLNIPFLRIRPDTVKSEAVALVPREITENYTLIPICITDHQLVVAMVNPLEFYAVDDLRFVTQMPVSIAVAPLSDIVTALAQFYPNTGLDSISFPGQEGDESIELIKQKDADEIAPEKLLKITELPPVVRFANSILSDAIKMNASDLHIEPQKAAVLVRYRVDGIMREMLTTDKHVHASLVSRLKVVSGMDISIRRKPQDGRAQVRCKGKAYDLRVSSIPTSYGEKITIRILSPDRGLIGNADIGFPPDLLAWLTDTITRPQGLFLVTGPTGSGKSSTLYACLNHVNSPQVNIVTVEDPVEFDIDGINQVQINPKAGVTFAGSLRSILRQDPDIVMVGEIRDRETAAIAFQAAQTGHLVLSSLHTNDAPSAVVRLLDLGVDPFLVAPSLIAVVGQRLVRRICSGCRVAEPANLELLSKLASHLVTNQPAIFYKGAGCEACQFTGYAGRMGIFEMYRVTPATGRLITATVNDQALKAAAHADGYRELFEDGLAKAVKGLTTIEELLRVAPPAAREDASRTDIPLVAGGVTEEEDVFSRESVHAAVRSVRPLKVLVVDDSDIVLKVIGNVLESHDFLVETAEDGEAALRLALREKPDLVITDLQMPKMDGLELVAKLRTHMATRYTPIIILTAQDEVDSEVQGIAAGADDYLAKPINPRRLMVRVNRLLTRQAAHD